MNDKKTDIIPKEQMLELLKKKAEMPESMLKAIQEQTDADSFASKIQTTIKNKYADSSEISKAKDFMSRYADKMKAPKGMSLEGIADDTPRLGMKIPSNMRKGALSKLIGAAGKFAGPAAVAYSALDQEELNPNTPAEDPSLSDEERMAYNIEPDAQETYLNELEAKKKDRYEMIKRKLAGE